jgi:hypothetical protein
MLLFLTKIVRSAWKRIKRGHKDKQKKKERKNRRYPKFLASHSKPN